jgi:hypothetical protein
MKWQQNKLGMVFLRDFDIEPEYENPEGGRNQNEAGEF